MITPALSLDFTSAVLSPLITFARAAATATRVNSSGLVEIVAADTPRFDYDPVSLVCKGLLIEESRTNRVLFSNQLFDFVKTNLNVTVNADTAPDGSTSASKLIETTGTGQHTASFTITTSPTAYAFSIFLKAGERTKATISNGAGFSVRVNLLTGVVEAGAGSLQPFGNGWYRCSFVRGNADTSIRPWGVGTVNELNQTSYTGDGTSGIYTWGAQFEIASTASSHIPTDGAMQTRNADVATITGTNFSDFWQSTRGGVLVRALPSTVSGIRPLVQFDDNTADNIIALRGNTTNPELYVRSGGADQATIDAGTIAANTAYRLAGTWATDNCAANLNGGVPVLDTSATIPTATQMRLGSDGTNYLNGHLQSVEYFDQRILNSNLQVVSSPAGYRSIIGPVLRDSIIT